MDTIKGGRELKHIMSMHVWGFYNSDGTPRKPKDAAPSEKDPYEHFKTVEANVKNAGAQIENLEVTRLIGGNFVGCSFDSVGVMTGEDEPIRIWHIIDRPQEEWPSKPPGPALV